MDTRLIQTLSMAPSVLVLTGFDWPVFIDDLSFSCSSHSIGIIAVSCGEGLSFDDRVDYFSRILMTSSLVLIWSFSDPIHPLVCVYVIK